MAYNYYKQNWMHFELKLTVNPMTVFKIFKIGLLPFDTIFLTGPFTQICLTLIWIYKADILCDHYKQANGGNHKHHDGLKNCFIVKLSTKISGVSLADWFYVIYFLTEPSPLFTSTEL